MTKPGERRGLAAFTLALVLAATACGAGGDAGGTNAANGSAAAEPSPAERTPLTITPEERASADFVLITGETRENLEIGGFGFEGEEILSPGPTIRVSSSEPVTIALENVHGYIDDETIAHNFVVVGEKDESAQPLWGAQTEILAPDEADLITFTADAPGRYFYICSLAGHMSAHGMWGRLVVE